MASTDREFDRLAAVTIQGGGVYGLSLLGQLSTLVYDLKVVPVALAGTSAGTVVAALYWAGWTPKELRGLFAEMADRRQLIELLGPFESNFTFQSFRALKGRFDGYLAQLEGLADAPPSTLGGRIWGAVKTPFQAVGGLWTASRIKADVNAHVKNRGVFKGENLEKKIDELVRTGPRFRDHAAELPRGRLLRFSDVRALTDRYPDFVLPPLFLAATNLTTRRLVLFNSVEDEHLNVPIARAVRASAGFPVFFRPVDVPGAADGGWFVDGGVISNFPAWVFSHDFRRRLAQSPDYRGVAPRPWVHIGLRLGGDETATPEADAGPKAFVQSMIALLAGQARSQLEDKLAALIDRSLAIRQPVNETGGPEHLLDVDSIDGAMVRDMYDRGAGSSRMQLEGVSFALPAPGQIEPLLGRFTAKALRVFGEPSNDRLGFRSNVYIPRGQYLHNRYSFNMIGAPDADLVLPFTSGLTGFCFTSRLPLMCNLARVLDLARHGNLRPDELFGMPKELHETVQATWLLSVPIFDVYAVYPRDLSSSRPRPRAGWPFSGPHSKELSCPIDGAVLGVLNLDATLPYEELGLNPDPAIHWTDVRIEAILNIATAVAAEIARVLADAFASPGKRG